MKADTKAKRRVTLSIGGLGWLDETEVDSIPDTRVFTDLAGEVEAPPAPEIADHVTQARKRFFAVARERGLERDTPDATRRAIHGALGVPDYEGSLRRWADRYGWDTARRLLEDGRTIQQYHAGDGVEDVDWEAAFAGTEAPPQRPEDAPGAH
jgi:hypothetical protein